MRIVGLFALVALAELAVFVWVQDRIGLLNSLLVALATAVVGSALVRRAGITVLGRIQGRLRAGSIPGRELTDGAAVLVAGALLISPGFLTDGIGFALLVPGVRDLVHRRVSAHLRDRVTIITPGGPTRRDPDIIDVEGWEEA